MKLDSREDNICIRSREKQYPVVFLQSSTRIYYKADVSFIYASVKLTPLIYSEFLVTVLCYGKDLLILKVKRMGGGLDGEGQGFT
jgi:hypothetical protein